MKLHTLCLALLTMLCLVACDSKKETPTEEVPPAEATTPVEDAGTPAEPVADMAAPKDDTDSGSSDAGTGANAPLKLKLDDTLMPATKSGLMPRLNIKPGELKMPIGKRHRNNVLPTQK